MTWKRSQVYEWKAMSMHWVLAPCCAHARHFTSTLQHWGGNKSISFWRISKARLLLFLEVKWLSWIHSARKGKGRGWDLNPRCLNPDPESPPPPHKVYSWIPIHYGRFRKAPQIEIGVELYSEATVNKQIHRLRTILLSTKEKERGRNELQYFMVDALSINSVAAIMKVLSAEQSVTSWFIMARRRGGSWAH